MTRRGVLISLALLGVGAAVLLSQPSVQDYLFSRSPLERFDRRFREFYRKESREPEIRRALGDVTREEDRSAKLRELAELGKTRLDNDTLLERARIRSVVYAHMSDRACAHFERGSGETDNDAAELAQAFVALGPRGVSKWMVCIHRAILAEVRKYPEPIVTRTEVTAAFVELERKIGRSAANRVDSGVNVHSQDAQLAYAARTIYRVAPTLPPPHGAVLLRMMEGAYKED